MAGIGLDSAKRAWLKCLVFMRTSSDPVSRTGVERSSPSAFSKPLYATRYVVII
jgi:hypothetical protein